MSGSLSHDDGGDRELVLLTTDPQSGAVVGAIALGDDWDRLLGALVIDAGRRAHAEPGA